MQALRFKCFVCLRSSWQRLISATLLRLVALTLVSQALPAAAAVKPESGFGLPHDVSQNGHLIDWLMNITHVFNIILFVIMCAWMAIAVVKHNRNYPAHYDPGSPKHSMTGALSICAGAVFSW